MATKVSVVINNFNYAEFLGLCIESAVSQTFENVEVIVSDDGSTDNSRAIIESYGSSIIASFKDNGGQGSALNAGYQMSSGDLIIFLDADDILSPSCVSEVVRHWQPDLMKLHFNLAIIDSSGKAIGRPYLKPPLPRGDLRQQLVTEGAVVSMPMSGNVFPRKLLNRIMPIPEKGWERGADVYLFNLAALSGKVGAIDEPLGGYRLHDRNRSAMTKRGKVDKAGLLIFLQREILTDQSLATYGQKIGVQYQLGTLTSSLPHLQQMFLHEKLYREDHSFENTSHLNLFLLYLKLLLGSKNLSLYKKVVIAVWSFLVLFLPKSLSEHLIVMGYRMGVVLAATRVVSGSRTPRGGMPGRSTTGNNSSNLRASV
jgi:glycosyltransferase involved in cell wall biosynthesis